MQINKAHCFFEQSGTFKKAFKNANIIAFDYDIQNEYSQTDFQIDLFNEIEKAYLSEKSIFDNITEKDLIFAFFPCIYFCNFSFLFFGGDSINFKNMSIAARNDYIIKINNKRTEFYNKLLKLFSVCEVRKLRLIVENPYTQPHYLRLNFPYKPALIDYNRTIRGDFFKKPTQYFFLNCEPEKEFNSVQKKTERKKILCCGGHKGSKCDRERSEISLEYATNFINDFIISKKTNKTELNIFNYASK